eukprot:TRINITY_DN61129_c0_g1_i1.p1 TRINITY_DN61129_c0_g1~~TRINITY_DN61129_c0_g1_i1.p1  ORF type:complete len:594 (-),score=23.90 TRINITY_DN61129_c0_g1_i1:1553-3334(-)
MTGLNLSSFLCAASFVFLLVAISLHILMCQSDQPLTHQHDFQFLPFWVALLAVPPLTAYSKTNQRARDLAWILTLTFAMLHSWDDYTVAVALAVAGLVMCQLAQLLLTTCTVVLADTEPPSCATVVKLITRRAPTLASLFPLLPMLGICIASLIREGEEQPAHYNNGEQMKFTGRGGIFPWMVTIFGGLHTHLLHLSTSNPSTVEVSPFLVGARLMLSFRAISFGTNNYGDTPTPENSPETCSYLGVLFDMICSLAYIIAVALVSQEAKQPTIKPGEEATVNLIRAAGLSMSAIFGVVVSVGVGFGWFMFQAIQPQKFSQWLHTSNNMAGPVITSSIAVCFVFFQLISIATHNRPLSTAAFVFLSLNTFIWTYSKPPSMVDSTYWRKWTNLFNLLPCFYLFICTLSEVSVGRLTQCLLEDCPGKLARSRLQSFRVVVTVSVAGGLGFLTVLLCGISVTKDELNPLIMLAVVVLLGSVRVIMNAADHGLDFCFLLIYCVCCPETGLGGIMQWLTGSHLNVVSIPVSAVLVVLLVVVVVQLLTQQYSHKTVHEFFDADDLSEGGSFGEGSPFLATEMLVDDYWADCGGAGPALDP